MKRHPAIEAAVNYEVSLLDLQVRSERRAWRIAIVSTALLAATLVGLVMLLPLKRSEPFVVLANTNTGVATVARLADRLPLSASASEAVDRANLASFIRARESYDSGTLGDRDWNQVFAMADDDVASAYRAVHAPTNPSQPFRVYGISQAVRPRISTLQIAAEPINGYRKATLRFARQVVDKHSGTARDADHWIAEIEYRYRPDLPMDDRDRLLNPLGFRVRSYRVDRDFTAGGAS